MKRLFYLSVMVIKNVEPIIMKHILILVLVLSSLGALGCHETSESIDTDTGTDTGAGTDADDDADTDTDVDSDLDMDTDTASDNDTGTDADTDEGADTDTENSIWGECGPEELAEPVPQGVYDALDESIEPGGFLHNLEWTCDVGQETSWSKPIRNTMVIEDIADAEKTDGGFLDFDTSFGRGFFAFLLCDGQYKWIAKVSEDEGVWRVDGAKHSNSTLAHMDTIFSETENSTCTKAVVLVDMTGLSCWLVTDKSKGPLFIPVEPSHGWGKEYSDFETGELVFTKDEFLEWCREYF